MTKTLTEQYRDLELPDGKYYIKLEPNFAERYDVGYSEGGAFSLYNFEDVEEVLAPVLPYSVLYDKDQGIFPVLNIVLRNIEREQCRRKLTDLELSIKSQVKGVLAFNGLVNKTYKSFGNTEQLEKVKEMSQKIERLELDNEALETAYNEVKEENSELEQYNKDLLQDHTRLVMECDRLLAENKRLVSNSDESVTKFHQLEKRLEIATKALEYYAQRKHVNLDLVTIPDDCAEFEVFEDGEHARQALKEMEGVK